MYFYAISNLHEFSLLGAKGKHLLHSDQVLACARLRLLFGNVHNFYLLWYYLCFGFKVKKLNKVHGANTVTLLSAPYLFSGNGQSNVMET